METSMGLSSMAQRVLLSFGILASLLKVGTDVLAVTRWKGYSFVARSISELSAHGAPTRSLVLTLDLVYAALMVAFSFGIWRVAGQNTLMRVGAVLVAANAVISVGVSLFLPMRIGQDGEASASPIHVILMAIGLFCLLFAIGFGGAAYRNWFRFYSFGTLLVFLGFTVARFVFPPPTTTGLPAPTVGIQERTMVLGCLLWVVALAIQHLSRLVPR